MTNICFITAIYGSYELSCKEFVQQTIDTDFICFTDNKNIKSNNWIIDTTPYHIINKSELDNDNYTNSMINNTHTFNIAKYYKQSFQNIPRLKDYDIIVWIDGTIEITNNKTSEYIINNINKNKIIGWHHENRYGCLINEVKASLKCGRYTTTFWYNQVQPYQDIIKQHKEYLDDGFHYSFFKNLEIENKSRHFGVWITCFIAFDNKDKDVKDFLNLWYLQTLKYTTQDQISFPYVCKKTNIIPYTLPNPEISGLPHQYTDFYIKQTHNK